MKKLFLTLAASAFTLATVTAIASTSRGSIMKIYPQNLTEVTDNYYQIHKPQDFKPLTPVKCGQGAPAYMDYILVNENFDKFTAGSEDAPDFKCPLASESDFEIGMWLDSTKTSDGSWSGSYVYSAGGCLALEGPGPLGTAYINTPLGDYSGELTVTFKAKPLKRPNNSCYLSVFANYGDIRNPKAALCDDATLNLYPSDVNWTEITVPLKNMSSNSDGYIQFQISGDGCLLIDDIKITTSPTFIAPPVLRDPVFNDNSITLNWDPVRRAYNYYLYLYKKSRSSDKDIDIYEDFENTSTDASSLPENWQFSENYKKYGVDNYGADDTKGLALCQGDTVTIYNNGENYKELQLWMRSVYESDEAALQDNDGIIYIEGYNGSRWFPLCAYYMNVLHAYDNPDNGMPDYIDMEECCQAYFNTFKDRYSKVRLTLRDSSDPTAWVVIDNVSLVVPPSYEYTLIPDYDGYKYTIIYEDNWFDILFDNYDDNYPYHGLKKEDDYYYELKSHYMYENSTISCQSVEGAYMPLAKEASNVTESGYDASWHPVNRASGYRIDHFSAMKSEDYMPNYTVFEENFNNAVSAIKDPRYFENINNPEGVMDEYCDYSGWTGKNNTFVNGMLGTCSGKRSYLRTPFIDFSDAVKAKIHISAHGIYGDAVIVTTSKGSWYVAIPAGDEMSHIDTCVEVDVDPSGYENIKFESAYQREILFDNIRISRPVNKDEIILYHIKSYEMDADCESIHISVPDTNSNGYAYTVTAYRDYNGNVKASIPSDAIIVGTPKTAGLPSTMSESADKYETGRYDINGMAIDKNAKGIQIIRYSDGSVSKIVVM